MCNRSGGTNDYAAAPGMPSRLLEARRRCLIPQSDLAGGR